MGMHTKEPWKVELVRKSETDFRAPIVGHDYAITGPDDICPAIVWGGYREGEPNASRIVACVNALAGIADPEAFIRAVDDLISKWSGSCTMEEFISSMNRLHAARG